MTTRRQFLGMAAAMPVAARTSRNRPGDTRSVAEAPRVGELGILLEAGIGVLLNVGDYEVHLWRNQGETAWRAMACFYADGVPVAGATGATPAEALWNLSAPEGDNTPYPGGIAQMPARLTALAERLEATAVALAEAEDRAQMLDA